MRICTKRCPCPQPIPSQPLRQSQSITLEWVKHFGLELEPFRPTELSEAAWLKGERLKISGDKPLDISQVPFDLAPGDRKTELDDLEEHYFGEVIRKLGHAIREDWPPEIMRLADIGTQEFLRQRGASA